MDSMNSRIEKLRDQDNWPQWKFVVRTLLEEDQDLLDVCEGSLVAPEEGDEGYANKLKKYQKADKAARKLIVTSVEKKPLDLLLTCKSAKEMWTKLNAVFDMKSEENLSLVQKQFFDLTWDSSESVVHNLTKMEQLSAKMKALNSEISSTLLLSRVLTILPPKFNYFHTAWESMEDSKKNFETLTTRLMSEELRLNTQEKTEEAASALFTNKIGNQKYKSDSRKNNNQQNKERKIRCYTCGSYEHKRKDCQGCFICGSKNHLKRGCPKNSEKPSTSQRENLRSSNSAEKMLFTGTSAPSMDRDCWLIDSGASDHMTHRKEWFCEYTEFKVPVYVKIGNGEQIEALGKGNIKIETSVDNKRIPGVLTNVLFVPCLNQNLFSVKTAAKKNINFLITDQGEKCLFTFKDKVIATGSDIASLYQLNLRVIPPKMCLLTDKLDNLQLWHERLCHQNKRHVKQFLNKLGIEVNLNSEFCDGCAYGKHHKSCFNERVDRAKEPREIIHSDVCGPMQVESLGRKKYAVIFKDEFSGYRKIYFIREKSEVAKIIKDFCIEIKNQFGQNIKELHTDGGKEYVNKEVELFLKNNGIKHTVTIAYSPQQNGVAERENRIIVEAARSMIYSKTNIPLSLWAEAMYTAAYVINITGPTKVVNKTPYELWSKKTATVNYLKVFGTECFIHIPGEKRKKFDKKAIRGIMVGYVEGCKGYRIYVPSKQDIVLSRDVLFKEEKLAPIETNVEIKNNTGEKDDDSLSNKEIDKKEISDLIKSDDETFESANEDESLDAVQDMQSSSETNTRQLRDRNSLRKTEFFGCPISFYAESLPTNYNDVLKSEDKKEWEKAMHEEIESLNQNNTWILVDKPEGQKILNSRWIFKIKINPDGTKRYKARLVIKGCSQIEGIDYTETFSPVVRFDTVRTMLSIAVKDDLILGQFDIKTAFLHGTLKENIYMRQPDGINDGSKKVCKLVKSLYGLKQAPRCWTEHFGTFVKNFGFKESEADPCLYIYLKDCKKLLLSIYVDDGLLAASHESLLDLFFDSLKKEFDSTTTKEVKSFLGLEIYRLKNNSIFISQEKYAEKILERYNMRDSNPVSTPIETGWNQTNSDKRNNAVPYREAVGNLTFLQVVSRPDIGFAVNIASRNLENPTDESWSLVKRILRYIKGTTDKGLLYSKSGVFETYCDADFAGDKDTRKSTTGVVCIYSNAAITWQSKRQNCVALSTTEAEYISAAAAAKEMVWIKRLLNDCQNYCNEYMLYVDNASAIKLIKNPELHQRSKHIDVRYHYVRNLYRDGLINVHYIQSEKQIADIFTKALPKPQFVNLRSKLGLVSKNEILNLFV